MPIKQEGRLEAVCEHQHKVCNEEGQNQVLAYWKLGGSESKSGMRSLAGLTPLFYVQHMERAIT
jgi:hypothetical protein